MTSPPAASPGFNVSARVSSAVPAGDADQAVRVARTQRHGALFLAQRRLYSVPTEITHGDSLESVETLTLRMNLLSQLPENFGKNLPNLAELYLHSNNLLTLPNALGSLPCLRVLDVSGNRLTSLPTSLGQLSSLTTLRLTHNHLQQLPTTLGLLPRLRTLQAAGNALSWLPASSLPASLCHLGLDSNRLLSLPRALCRLPALAEVTAADNRLRSLPMDLGRSGKLQLLFVDENPNLSLLPCWLHNLTLGCVGCGTEVGLVKEVTLGSPGLPDEIR
uniref:Leucine-rich repeat-containing protein 28-like n=1 Tax=Petromyzon marinus TaxID=7757 RepID=A0AAJ7SL02_PETMA|nr:leucine-rich repeat-containing protein 28-like [Petromyzon marinus]